MPEPPRGDKRGATSALCFDYGTKKIGVAYGQNISGTAKALPPIAARDGVPDWDIVARLLEEWAPQCLVVGLPLNMDDSESAISTRARKFARRLHGRYGLPVTLVDERLTTRQAREEAMPGESVDSVAAAILLRNWFSAVDC